MYAKENRGASFYPIGLPDMKIICVGRNYAAHAHELNNPAPSNPVIFMKPETALLQGRQPFFIPKFSKEIHHEVELVVKINRNGKNIQEKFAHKYYDEIGIGIDFTARDLQAELKSKGLPWELAKAFDGSAPAAGFTSKKELGDLNQLKFSLQKNGNTVQEGKCSDMIFSIDYIISFVSEYFMLKKGDLIFTGTPQGVGRIEINDVLDAFIGNNKLLTVKIK